MQYFERNVNCFKAIFQQECSLFYAIFRGVVFINSMQYFDGECLLFFLQYFEGE